MDEDMREIRIASHGSLHIFDLPWHLAVLLEWALPAWAEDKCLS